MDFSKLVLNAVPSDVDGKELKMNDFISKTNTIPEEYEGIAPTIYNQGSSSMCVAFAVAGLKEIQEFIERGVRTRFSPAYLYGIRDGGYKGEGMMTKDCLKDLRRFGIVRYEDFPMVDSYVNVKRELDVNLHKLAPHALGNAIKSYVKLETNEDVQKAIIDNGGAIMGTAIFESFYYPTNGVIPDKKAGERLDGGHGMVVFGWKIINGRKYWKVANSWGATWGDRGFCYIPFDYSPIYEFYTATDLPLVLNDTTKLIMYLGDTNLRIIKNDTIIINETMEIAPFAQNGRTLVPISLIARAFNAEVEWHPEWGNCIIINKGDLDYDEITNS